jgi:hypothetical protein
MRRKARLDGTARDSLRAPPRAGRSSRPDLLRAAVNAHRIDCPLQRGISFLAEADPGVQPRHVKGGAGAEVTSGIGKIYGIPENSATGFRDPGAGYSHSNLAISTLQGGSA